METNVQETSLAAYHDEVKPTLTSRHSAVVAALKRYEDATNNELAQVLGWQINRVTPRIFELREMGAVVESQRRKDLFTGRLSIAWKVNPSQNA